MGIFATLVRRGAQAEVTADAVPAGGVLGTAVPARFEAVGERLAAGHDASSACAVVGREMARDGADLGEALDGLRATYARVQGGEPDFRAAACSVRGLERGDARLPAPALVRGPSDGAGQPCARAGQALGGLSRGRAGGAIDEHQPRAGGGRPPPARTGPSEGGPAATGERARWSPVSSRPCGWPGWPTTHAGVSGRGDHRTGRPETAGRGRRARGACSRQRVGLLRGLVEDLDPRGERARVWIEGLPPSDDGAGLLLDEIARS